MCVPSKGTSDRAKICELVVQSGRTHAAAIRSAVNARFQPLATPERPVPDAGNLALLAVDDLQADMDRLIAAENVYEAELQDDADPRRRRDEGGEKVRGGLVELREGLVWVYGPAVEEAVGFAGTTSEDPRVVALLAAHVLAQCPDVLANAKAKPNRTYDAGPVLAQIAADLPGLELALQDVAREVREAEAALVAKYAAMDAYDHTFRETAGLLWALLTLAGEHELAERVRPAKRQGGRTAQEAGESGPSTASTIG